MKLWKELSKCWYDCKIIILTINFYSIIGDLKKLNNSLVTFVTPTDISIIWMQQWTCVSEHFTSQVSDSFSPLTDFALFPLLHDISWCFLRIQSISHRKQNDKTILVSIKCLVMFLNMHEQHHSLKNQHWCTNFKKNLISNLNKA